MNRTYGGKGGRSQHGRFSTNHGCTYDPRNGMIGVSECAPRPDRFARLRARTRTLSLRPVVHSRANSRFEYFKFDVLVGSL